MIFIDSQFQMMRISAENAIKIIEIFRTRMPFLSNGIAIHLHYWPKFFISHPVKMKFFSKIVHLWCIVRGCCVMNGILGYQLFSCVNWYHFEMQFNYEQDIEDVPLNFLGIHCTRSTMEERWKASPSSAQMASNIQEKVFSNLHKERTYGMYRERICRMHLL